MGQFPQPCREPADALLLMRELFPGEVLNRIGGRSVEETAMNGRDIRDRHRILAADDASSSGERPLRDTWAKYLVAARDCGLLMDHDVIARLTGTCDDGFRSALAECAAAWFLTTLGFAVKARPEQTTSRNVDLLATFDTTDVYVEVKAPYVPRPPHRWAGDDAAALRKCVMDAGNGQFKRGRVNLLLVVPALRNEIYHDRGQLLKATIGEMAIAVPVSLDDRPAPPAHPTFLQTGKLARPRRTAEGAFTTDFTRISAVMSLEHRFRYISDDETEIRHSAIVIHNPFAAIPIPSAAFGDLPQWVVHDGMMGWSDHYKGP